jgi:hypothetical protein
MIRLSPKPCSSPSRALDAERYFVAGGNDRIMVSLLEVFERADVLRIATAVGAGATVSDAVHPHDSTALLSENWSP